MLEIPNEVLEILGSNLGKGGLSKILGPTAEYLGDELKSFAQKRLETVGKIFSNTEKKLGKKVDTPGRVPPKVLKTIIDEGSYADDDIAVEYFGGVLASSRTCVNRDDRGARLAKLIDGMSTYQIRTHYLIYSTISQLFSNSKYSFQVQKDREEMRLFMPMKSYVGAMQFTQAEFGNPQIMIHIFHGLGADGLISENYASGSKQFLEDYLGNIPSNGIACIPTSLGAELLLWAFGHGDKELDFLLSGEFSSEIEGIPKSISNSIATNDLKEKSG